MEKFHRMPAIVQSCIKVSLTNLRLVQHYCARKGGEGEVTLTHNTDMEKASNQLLWPEELRAHADMDQHRCVCNEPGEQLARICRDGGIVMRQQPVNLLARKVPLPERHYIHRGSPGVGAHQ